MPIPILISRALSLTPLLLLASCATDAPMGASVVNNVVAQTVDLNPQYAGVPAEGSNGSRSVDAYKRYLKGSIVPLQRPDGKGSTTGGAAAAPATQ